MLLLIILFYDQTNKKYIYKKQKSQWALNVELTLNRRWFNVLQRYGPDGWPANGNQQIISNHGVL